MKIFAISPNKRGNEYYSKKLEEMGHSVFWFANQVRTRKAVFMGCRIPFYYQKKTREMNEKLTEEALGYNPDLILSFKGANVYPEKIKELKKKLKITTILWFPDDPFYFDKYGKKIAPAYDHVFTNAPECVPKYENLGVDAETLMFGCNTDIFKSLDLTQEEKNLYGSDITFIGNSYPDRIKLLTQISDYDLKVWGPNWSRKMLIFKFLKRGRFRDLYKTFVSNLTEKCTNKYASYEEVAKIYNASKITVDYPKSLNMRLFEATGSECLLITKKLPHLEDCFEVGEEILCYDNIADLREKLDYYLNNPREREEIAKAGQKRTHKNHKLKDRFQKIFDKVSD